MTLNGVTIALILRYFTEFGSFRGALCENGWICRRKKVHVRYLISWWVSCQANRYKIVCLWLYTYVYFILHSTFWSSVDTIQPVVKPVVNTVWQLYLVYKHSTGCQTRLTTGLTIGCIVYAASCQTGLTIGCIVHTAGCQSGCTIRFDNRLNEQWLFVQHGCQSGCKQTGCKTGLTTGFHIRLYRVNGAWQSFIKRMCYVKLPCPEKRCHSVFCL